MGGAVNQVRAGNGTAAATVGSVAGAYAGFVVFGLIGSGIGILMLSEADECAEKLCGLGEALAAVLLGIAITAAGAFTMMLIGCRYALIKKGFGRVAPTLIWLGVLAPALLIAGASLLPDPLNTVWIFATPVIAAPLARRFATIRAA